MSYLALARKWRPSNFNQVVGQSHVLTALENALSQNKLHHAYLFSGTRGVGKTSIGRLFAKGLNCETGITARPCGQCDACKEIDEGRFVDLLEIDAASRTKVEDTRELLDNVQYKPARGRFKVYLIDEVHMLSRHSFNALLKTLEEPPEYVKFLLATTDPQKLPITILSRCLQFHLKPISVDVLHEQLNYILPRENVVAEQRALGMIAHAADGSMRDALSLTDQAIALGNGTVSVETVSTMLGTLDADQAIYLLDAIASKQVQRAMSSVQAFAENGVDWDSLLQELTYQLHRIAMYQALPASLDKSKPDAEKIELVSQRLAPQDVQLYYQIALKGRQDLPLAPTARIGLEMVVLRMMAFRPINVDVASAIELPKEPSQNSGPSTHSPVLPSGSSVAIDPQQSNAVFSPSSSALSENDYPSVSEEYVQQIHSETEFVSNTNQPGSTPTQVQSIESQETPLHEKRIVTEPSNTTRSSIAGLRHQLRSKRAIAPSSNATAGTDGKKREVSPPNSAMERVAQQHGVAKVVSPAMSNYDEKPEDEMDTDRAYQWKPTTPVVIEESESELTPTQIKKALAHTKTSEMIEKLIDESVAQDEWAALIQQLDIAKLVEQLALNSSYEKQGSIITLSLRPSHAHLNTDKAQDELLHALNPVLGEDIKLVVEVSDKGQTPLELREAIYQGKLQFAHQRLNEDKNVQFIQTRFSAELDTESVRPI